MKLLPLSADYMKRQYDRTGSQKVSTENERAGFANCFPGLLQHDLRSPLPHSLLLCEAGRMVAGNRSRRISETMETA